MRTRIVFLQNVFGNKYMYVSHDKGNPYKIAITDDVYKELVNFGCNLYKCKKGKQNA